MIAESARYNIGRGVRTVNVPSFALFFLYPGNQSRFRFESAASHPPDLPDPPVVTIRYRERGNPTMILSTKHQDLPASGIFRLETATGRVLLSRMDVKVDRHWAITIEVTYGHDGAVDAWVPQTLHERAGRPVAYSPEQGFTFAGDETLDCTATYANFRRFRTDARIVR